MKIELVRDDFGRYRKNEGSTFWNIFCDTEELKFLQTVYNRAKWTKKSVHYPIKKRGGRLHIYISYNNSLNGEWFFEIDSPSEDVLIRKCGQSLYKKVTNKNHVFLLRLMKLKI